MTLVAVSAELQCLSGRHELVQLARNGERGVAAYEFTPRYRVVECTFSGATFRDYYFYEKLEEGGHILAHQMLYVRIGSKPARITEEQLLAYYLKEVFS